MQAQLLIERLTNMGFKAVKEQKGDRIAIAIVCGIDANTKEVHFKTLLYVGFDAAAHEKGTIECVIGNHKLSKPKRDRNR